MSPDKRVKKDGFNQTQLIIFLQLVSLLLVPACVYVSRWKNEQGTREKYFRNCCFFFKRQICPSLMALKFCSKKLRLSRLILTISKILVDLVFIQNELICSTKVRSNKSITFILPEDKHKSSTWHMAIYF